jgi:uncharacterized alkaline shock family protein YloU
VQTQDNTGVIIAFISCLGVGAIVALEICAPTANNIQAITIIIGFLTPTVVGMLGLMKSQENGKAIDKMHNSTDSTLSQISLNAKTAADKAEVAAVKADVAAVNIEAAVKNGHTIVETANKIAETVTKTAQNVEAIKQNGH